MYVSFLREVPSDFYYKYRERFFTEIDFSDPESQKDVIDFINRFGYEEYKKLFDIIGIKYDNISKNGLTYTIKDTELVLNDLSSGERSMLFVLIESKLEKITFIIGFADRIDRSHVDSMINILSNRNCICVLEFDSTILNTKFTNSKYYRPFTEVMDLIG